MVSMNDPAEKMRKELDALDKKARRTREIVDEGSISRRFGEYLEQLLMMDFCSKEVIFLHKNPEYGDPIKSLTKMKLSLDHIAGLFLEDEPITRRKSGLYIVHKPNFEDVERYGELYNLAKQRFDETVEEYERLIGAAA